MYARTQTQAKFLMSLKAPELPPLPPKAKNADKPRINPGDIQ